MLLARFAPGQGHKHRAARDWQGIESFIQRDRIEIFPVGDVSHPGLELQVRWQPVRADRQVREPDRWHSDAICRLSRSAVLRGVASENRLENSGTASRNFATGPGELARG